MQRQCDTPRMRPTIMTNFHEDFAHRDIVPPSERSTGLVFTAMTGLVAVLWYRTPAVWVPAGILALGFLFLSLLAPTVLRPLNLLWFRLSMVLYRIVNPVVMLLMYALAIVPAGLIMQRFRDPLQTKPQRDSKSYWLQRPSDSTAGSMKNQF